MAYSNEVVRMCVQRLVSMTSWARGRGVSFLMY